MTSAEPAAPIRALITMPVATQRGGAEVQLKHLIEHRAEARIEPTVAFMQPGPLPAWCREQGVKAVVIDAGRFRQLRRLGHTVRTLVKVARDERCDVVIGWMAKGQLYGGLAAAGSGLPSVWIQTQNPAGSAWIDRAATLLPTRLVITVSRTVDRSQRKLFPRRPTVVVYPAVDTARFDASHTGGMQSARRRLGLPEDVPIFGSVGRLDRWKGFHFLLDAFPGVRARYPDAMVVLVGGPHELDPAYARELEDQARSLGGNGSVVIAGQQPNPEDWIQAMDVFAHTSHTEPFGMVVIEAMALGKPVVATAEGGPTEIITSGVDGLLSPYGEPQALGAGILRFLDDAGLRDSVGAAAKQRAQDFGVEHFARQFGAVVATAVTRAQ
jgi:glycosyltransferase involved in cell wall biosynthesis